jgi:murein DD-endopeptidase MepM/ murein hydrolase activator NlpD
MAAFLEKQHVAKRANSHQRGSSSRHYNKSADFNTGFMSHFTQKPARSGRKSSVPEYAFADQQKKQRQERPKKSGLSFPVPSLATIAVIAGTVLICLAALKWEDLRIKLPERYAFQLDAENIDSQTRQYASTGVPSLLSVTIPDEPVPVKRPEEAETAKKPDALGTELKQSLGTELNKPAQKPEEPAKDLITFQWQQYKVQKGDSVSGIAKKFGISLGAVIASNNIRNARQLKEGVTLRIPNIDGIPYSIKSGDSLSKISVSFNVPLEVILDINDLKSDVIKAGETIFIPGARMNDLDLRMSLGELFIYPVSGKYITSNFGMRKDPISGELSFHTGIDLRANTGASVMASMEGVVSVIGENRLYGKFIILSHPNGYKTMYAHLNAVSVKQGDKAAQGRKIGEAGNTGYSTGAHLHFTIYDKNEKLINPLDLLN